MSEPGNEVKREAENEQVISACMNFVTAENANRNRNERAHTSKVVRLLELNPLGMTLPEMAGGPGQVKRIKTLRPLLAEAVRLGIIMPVSQRAGHTVYRLVKNLGPR